MPARLSGSASDNDTSSKDLARRRTSRRSATASGSANCSPEARATKRPPRSSPRVSRRIDRDQLAPRRQPRLPRTEAPEYHHVAVQQHARREFGTALDFSASRAGFGAGERGRGARQSGQGPAARGGHLRRPRLARPTPAHPARAESARSPAKPSHAASPWPASSDSAVSSWLGKSRRRATRSSKNSTPLPGWCRRLEARQPLQLHPSARGGLGTGSGVPFLQPGSG
jgi:hypothetical protein